MSLDKNFSFQPVDFDPFADNIIREVPTTEPQREIWTNIQIGGYAASCAYNESVSLHLNGPFNIDALRKAVPLLFERHDALRATFSNDGLLMRIGDTVSHEVSFIDLSSTPESQSKDAVKTILDNETRIEFNLSEGPLGKISIIRLSATRHILVITFHHIVCDGWSLGIIMQDLGKMYNSFIKGISYSDEPAYRFTDYALEESEYYKSDENRNVEKFWLEQFRNDVPVIELPLNKKRPPFRTYNAGRIDLEIDKNILARVKKIGAAKQTSFVATLMAAFEIFIYRITGNNDVVVGLAAAGQAAEGKELLVGHCVNLLPLRSKINEKESFNDYLTARRTYILDAYDHQRYTFGSLIRQLNIPRDPSRIPLVPVSFNVDLGLTNGVSFDECEFYLTTNARHYENFEFFVNAAGSGNELTLECTYNTDLFTEAMMQLRMEEFAELLKSISLDPSEAVSKLNILTGTEKAGLLHQWQGEKVKLPGVNGIHQRFEYAAKTNPSKTAIIFNDQRITYNELNRKADKIASYISGKGKLVGILMDRSPEMIISILAILKAGAAYVPIDLSNPAERISFILNDSGAQVLITQQKHSSKITGEKVEIIFTDNFNEIYKHEFSESKLSLPTSDSLCYVIYTSGSTGKPKGVDVSHGSVINYISWCNNYYFENPDEGNFGLYSSLSFDLTVTSIFCPLTRGTTLTVFRQHEEINDILKKTFSNTSAIDIIKLTPAHILLLEAMELKSSMPRKAIVGGEELTQRHVEILKSINPDIDIYNEYGPTEATVGCIVKNVMDISDVSSIGKPISNTSVYILDKNLQVVPPGITGTIYITGDGLALGYHNNPAASADKFININAGDTSLRAYNSGDVGRFNIHGEIEYLGRADNQVKIRGYRIEPGEIEVVLSQLASVKEQTVIAWEDDPGSKKLVAYLVMHPGESANEDDLRNFLRDRLPEYMVPAQFIFIPEMPLTANGKIDRKALPSPLGITRQSRQKYEEPANATEEVLSNIWCSVLNIEKAGRKDNFFELGGHSILGVRMFNEVEKKLGARLPLSALFRYPTIESLAGVIKNDVKAATADWEPVAGFRTEGSKHPLFCIHMHNGNIHRWRVLLNYIDNDRPLYAIQPRGLDDRQKPHMTIEEMSAYYVQEIRKIQPEGPYHLIGLCFSGMVVFEMSVILQSMGQKVAFLGMVNNYAPPENPLIYKVKNELNKFMKLEIGEKFNYAVEKNLNLGKKLLYKARNFFPGEQHDQPPVTSYGNDLRTIHSLALLNYHPVHTYHGDLQIFRTADPIDELYNEHLGWDRLIKGKIETTVIAGSDNDTIITDAPYNRILGQKINEILER